MKEINEECGVLGIYSTNKIKLDDMLYYGLFALQHRGQESCGIAVVNNKELAYYKNIGLVEDVLNESNVEKMEEGNIAIGHVRYATTGKNSVVNAQPMVSQHLNQKMGLVHNGNLVNSKELRNELEKKGFIFEATSDTEVISYIITENRLETNNIVEAVKRTMKTIKGAYCLIIMTSNELIVARDPNGFRPLCYGKTKEGTYIIASESCALDALGADFIRDVEPGEILVFGQDGISSYVQENKVKQSMCIFEYIYFARPDSIIENVSVHRARISAGKYLARSYPVDADIVIGVPDSGLDAAIGYSRESKIPYEVGFIKNKYIGRTFIAPGQKSREDKVKIKLNAISELIKGKRVILVDDSIVRGTTCARIVNILREAGAKEVHMRVSAPPFLNPCYYGTDIDTRKNLIASNHTMEEIKNLINVDTLGFLKVEDLEKIIDNKVGICKACFTNEYPTEIPTE